MKNLIMFLVFILFSSVSYSQETKVDTITKDVTIEQVDSKITRVYKYKNSRIKRELKFTTKKNKPKYC